MGRLVGIVGVVALLMGGFVIAPQSVTGASAMNASPATVPIPAGRIAYVGTDNKLHVMNGDGSGDMIVPTQGKPSYPRWSPKTEEIAFVEQLSVEPRIDRVAVVNPATASTRVLVGPEIARVNPDQYFAYHHIGWTPDGSGVLYRKNGGNRTLQFLMRVDAAGGTPQAQGYACTTCGFDISPTDGRIAMVENSLSQPITLSLRFA